MVPAEEDQEKGDYLSVYASKQATKTRDSTSGTTVYSTRGMGHASAGVSTQVMGVGDEWTCRSWIQATSASNLVSAPGKGRIPDTVTGDPETMLKEKFRNNFGIAWALVSFKRGIAALYNKRGIFPGGGLVRVDFDHTKSAEGNFSSTGSPSPLPDLNPWASTSVNIAGRAHVGIAPDINLAEASTPKCTGDEKHDIPLGHGQKCPGIPGQDYTSPDNDLLGQGSIDPPPESTNQLCFACNGTHTSSEASNHEWGTPACGDSTHAGYACQITASDHQWGTFPCGDVTHVGYLCQVSSDHSTLITSYSGSFYECQPHQTFACGHTDLTANSYSHRSETCPTDSNGQSCEYGSFYACSPHTHAYPAIVCGAASWTRCTAAVSSSTEHQTACSNCSQSYWSCNLSAVAWHATPLTCQRSGCNVSLTKCQNTGGGGCFSNGTEYSYHDLP